MNTFAPEEQERKLREYREHCMAILDFPQMETRQAAIKPAHQETCRWLLERSKYYCWKDVSAVAQHHGFLRIKGKPAAGKSTVMKFLYANEIGDSSQDKNAAGEHERIVLAFFFNARGTPLEKSTEGMYRSFLVQLLTKVKDLQEVLDQFQNTLRGINRMDWSIVMLQSILERLLLLLGTRSLVCFVDALDECDDDQVRDMIRYFGDIGEKANSAGIRFRTCLSSRHYPYITIRYGLSIVLEEQQEHKLDIERYIAHELRIGAGPRAAALRDKVLAKASGVFLWVALAVPMLNRKHEQGRIGASEALLDKTPERLEELFDDILKRDAERSANTQERREMFLCMRWVLYAFRPLTPTELYFAILAGTNSDFSPDWDETDISGADVARFILDCSRGLVEVTSTSSLDCKVQFVHESVRQFFLEGYDIIEHASHQAEYFDCHRHEQLKNCCDVYNKLSDNRARACTDRAKQVFPFLDYAVDHVLRHSEAAHCAAISQKAFIANFDSTQWARLRRFNNTRDYAVPLDSQSFGSLLHVFTAADLPSLINIEVDDTNMKDIEATNHGYPLLDALNRRNMQALRALLTPRMQPSGASNVTSSPKLHAPGDLDGVIDDMIQEAGKMTAARYRPLAWMARLGNLPAVQCILATNKVDVDAVSGIPVATALFHACRAGKEKIVEALLRAGSRQDLDDSRGTPALVAASRRGYTTIVRSLLEAGSNVNSMDVAVGTALYAACAGGHSECVKVLIDAGADPNIVSVEDQLLSHPLIGAAARGRHDVVRMLSESYPQAAFDPTVRRKAIERASSNGHEAVVKALLPAGSRKVRTAARRHHGRLL